MDMLLVPAGFLIMLAYHLWLWHMSRSQPFTTIFGRDADGRRFWVPAMMKVTDTHTHRPKIFFFLRNMICFELFPFKYFLFQYFIFTMEFSGLNYMIFFYYKD